MKPRMLAIPLLLVSLLVGLLPRNAATAPPTDDASPSDSPAPLLQSGGTTTRVSIASNGTQGNADSGVFWVSIADNARYVAFNSYASNLVAGDTNGEGDAFVHDLQTGETTRVSVASDGTEGNDVSVNALDISADGRFVAFSSYASNLVSGDTNNNHDVFVRDRQTGQTTRVSVASDGSQANSDSGFSVVSLSADGRYVAFYSYASNLIAGDTNGEWDVFVHDRQTAQTFRVSVGTGGVEANNTSAWMSISADGRYVAFQSDASNLVPADTNGTGDVFVHDRQTLQTTRVSVPSDGAQGNATSGTPTISADGRYVAFDSYASNLIAGDTNGECDVFVHDRQTAQTSRVSVASNGTQGNAMTHRPCPSADGRYVAFESDASNLVPGDTNGISDVFVHDRATGSTTRVSVGPGGVQANGSSASGRSPTISADGRYVAFPSDASNLVVADTNGKTDAFVHDRGAADTTTPAAVTDLVATTGPSSGTVTLSWTAPGDDGNTGMASLYTVRHAESPIVSEFGWLMATDVLGEPTPQTAGSGESMTLSGLPSATPYYFAIKTHDEVPNTSGLSNSPGIMDLGFRATPDGYGFPNYGGVNYADYTTDDMRRMFGDAAVCHMEGALCHPRPTAEQWNRLANEAMNGGHCDGMASTSLRFFKDLDNPGDFQLAANTTHDLQLGNVRRHIAYYFVRQLTDPVKSYKEQVRQGTPSTILDELHSAISGSAADPTTLFVRQAGQGGHAITPYSIEDRGGGVYWVRVYDNNHPNDGNRYVVINTTNDTWSYNLGWATWSGDTNTDSLGIVPISKYAQQSVCPWCAGAGALSAAPSGEIFLTGGGHLLITDGAGRRIGYIGDQFVNEIPGAYGSIFDAGLGIETEPVYTLPLTETYTILVSGQTLTQTQTVGVAQFGPGYAVSVSDLTLGPTSGDGLIVAPDGAQLAYQSSDDKEATLTLALDGAGQSNQLQLSGADIAAGQPITLTADVDIGQLAFDNSQAGGGTYDLQVTLLSAAGGQWFVHTGVAISATDTHYADYGAWDGHGSMTLYVDQGTDGNIDETVILDNQAPRVCLPLVLRNH